MGDSSIDDQCLFCDRQIKVPIALFGHIYSCGRQKGYSDQDIKLELHASNHKLLKMNASTPPKPKKKKQKSPLNDPINLEATIFPQGLLSPQLARRSPLKSRNLFPDNESSSQQSPMKGDLEGLQTALQQAKQELKQAEDRICSLEKENEVHLQCLFFNVYSSL